MRSVISASIFTAVSDVVPSCDWKSYLIPIYFSRERIFLCDCILGHGVLCTEHYGLPCGAVQLQSVFYWPYKVILGRCLLIIHTWCEFVGAEPQINPSFFLLLLSEAFVHSWWGIRVTAVTVKSLITKFYTMAISGLNSVMVLTVILSQSIFFQEKTVSLIYFSVLLKVLFTVSGWYFCNLKKWRCQS